MTTKCKHGNNEFECSYCFLEDNNYFGYIPEYYNLAYKYYLNSTLEKHVYKRSYFYKTKYFDKFYNKVLKEKRIEKIVSLW